jgi:hypothetical protein
LSKSKGWIGVDLDGTLAVYDEWRGPTHIGEPVPEMLARVIRWISEGREVRILTARVSSFDADAVAAMRAIRDWTEFHTGRRLAVTCVKDFDMVELWDDRAVQVEANTGRRIGESTRGLD